MEKFKVGDKVKIIEEQDGQGKVGLIGIIKGIGENDKDCYQIEFPNGFNGHSCGGIVSNGNGYNIKFHRVELVKKGEKLKPEDLTRYMAYGDGCDNKSNLYTSEKEMSEYARKVARDSSWTGEIIGYKLIPLFKVEKKTILKKYNLTKKRAKK